MKLWCNPHWKSEVFFYCQRKSFNYSIQNVITQQNISKSDKFLALHLKGVSIQTFISFFVKFNNFIFILKLPTDKIKEIMIFKQLIQCLAYPKLFAGHFNTVFLPKSFYYTYAHRYITKLKREQSIFLSVHLFLCYMQFSQNNP